MFNELQSSPYTLCRRIKDIIYHLPNQILTLINAPGFVREIEYPDWVTGDNIRIKVGKYFTVISVNHRDYWFRRADGKFDGTGYSYCVPIEESVDCILDCIPVSIRLLSFWGRLRLLLQSIGRGCFQ